MKQGFKIHLFLSCLIAVILIIGILAKPVITSLVRMQLGRVFPGSIVSIENSRFQPLRSFTFLGLKISKKPLYEIEIKEAGINYSFPSLFFGIIKKVYLNEASVSLEQTPKLKIESINMFGRLRKRELFLDSVTAKAEGGTIAGKMFIVLGKLPAYSGDFKFSGLDLERLIGDFNLKEKIEMTGKAGGEIVFSGEGVKLSNLSGNLASHGSGGVVAIKDTKFLENAARYSGQSPDILVESFKDFRYNTGIMKMSLEKNDLRLDIALGGEAGKRNLNIVVHDFKIGGAHGN